MWHWEIFVILLLASISVLGAFVMWLWERREFRKLEQKFRRRAADWPEFWDERRQD